MGKLIRKKHHARKENGTAADTRNPALSGESAARTRHGEIERPRS
jgi:hypothetical protein